MIFTREAEEKLLEISFAVPSEAASVIRTLAENAAQHYKQKRVTVRQVQDAYRYWQNRLKQED